MLARSDARRSLLPQPGPSVNQRRRRPAMAERMACAVAVLACWLAIASCSSSNNGSPNGATVLDSSVDGTLIDSAAAPEPLDARGATQDGGVDVSLAVDSGPVDLGSSDSGEGACNAVVNAAPQIDEIDVAGPLPVGIGGPLVAAGTYYRTASEFYTGPGGPSGPNGIVRKETIVITSLGNNMFKVDHVNSVNGAADSRSTQTAVVTGNTITVTSVCPTPGKPNALSYTSSGGTLTVYNNLINPPEASVYTAQP